MAEAQNRRRADDPYRTEVEGRAAPSTRRGGLSSAPPRSGAYPSIDEVYRESAYKDNIIQPTLGRQPKEGTRATDEVQLADETRRAQRLAARTATTATTLQQKQLINLGEVGESAYLKAKSTRIAWQQLSWNIPYWLTIQLPLAMICVMAFGLTGVVEAATSTWVGRIVGSVIGGVASVLEYAGINVSSFNPTNLFLILLFALAGLSLLVFLITTLVYMIYQLNPLSGKGLAFKYAAVIIVIIGYSMPLLNLFPWILLYIFVVWRYPR